MLDLSGPRQHVDSKQHVVVAHLVTRYTKVVTAVLVGHGVNSESAIGKHFDSCVKTAIVENRKLQTYLNYTLKMWKLSNQFVYLLPILGVH